MPLNLARWLLLQPFEFRPGMNLLGTVFLAFGAASVGLMGTAPVEEGFVALGGTALFFTLIGVYTLTSEWISRRQQRKMWETLGIPQSGTTGPHSWARVLGEMQVPGGRSSSKEPPNWNEMRQSWREGRTAPKNSAIDRLAQAGRLKLS